MWYLDEALARLAEEYSGKDVFHASNGKSYRIKNGHFVEITGGGDDGESQEGQNGQDDQEGQQGREGQESQKGDKGDKGNKGDGPTIGDEGNSQIQQLEDLLREIQEIKNQLGRIEDETFEEDESSINDISSEIIGNSEDLQDKIDELTEQLEKLRKELKEKGGDLHEQTEDEIKEKADHIREIFDDIQVSSDLMDETQKNVSRSRKEKRRGEKAAKEAAKAAAMSDTEVIALLKQSLNQTLKAEIHEQQEDTWSKINKKAYGAGILKKGSRISEKVDIPTLAVYFDRSASWGPSETKFGQEAVNSIMYLEKKGLLKVLLYYFNSSGVLNVDPGRGTGGTPAAPVFNHIQETKPDNVLIMTDDDFDGQGGYEQRNTTVKGAVWLLFKGSIAKSLREKLHGRKMTKTFFIK